MRGSTCALRCSSSGNHVGGVAGNVSYQAPWKLGRAPGWPPVAQGRATRFTGELMAGWSWDRSAGLTTVGTWTDSSNRPSG